MSYTTDSGIFVRMGTEEAELSRTGTASVDGLYGQIRVILDADHLPSVADGRTLIDVTPHAAIPVGSIVTKAVVHVLEAFDSAGDAATLTLGLAEHDGTLIDEDAIDATVAQSAIDAVGELLTCDGVVINGAKSTKNAFVTATVGTASFTAGKAILVVEYLKVD